MSSITSIILVTLLNCLGVVAFVITIAIMLVTTTPSAGGWASACATFWVGAALLDELRKLRQ